VSRDRRPNILYVVAHDLGQELGCYGKTLQTPEIDRFAAESVRFTRCFTSSPACAPSRACAYTGLPAHLHGAWGVTPSGCYLPRQVMTVVDHFNLNGYETVHAGVHHERQYAAENRYQREFFRDQSSKHAENAVKDAIGYLKQRQPGSPPFYLNLGTVEVHSSQWQDLNGVWRDRYGIADDDDRYYPDGFPEAPQLRREARRFHACLRYLDHHMGRLIDAVDRLGYRDNTVVIFTTDHGIAGPRGKGTLYDMGTELALLVRRPGLNAGGRTEDALLQNMDIAPTLLDIAEIAAPRSMHGRSFWPLTTGHSYTPHQRIFLQRNFHGTDIRDTMRACRTREHLYILNLEPDAEEEWRHTETPPLSGTYDRWFPEMWPPRERPRPREELYNVADDPRQVRNLADDPQHAVPLNLLAKHVRDHMQTTRDPAYDGELYSVNMLERAAGRHFRWKHEAPCEPLPEPAPASRF
jgi:arylsulfatase A-like enzyme